MKWRIQSPPYGPKHLLFILELESELEAAGKIVFDLLRAISLGGNQAIPKHEAELELYAIAAWYVETAMNNREPPRQMAVRFQVHAKSCGPFAGLEPGARGLFALPRFRQVIGQKLRLAFGRFGIHLGQRRSDPGMQPPSLAVQQARARGILDQHVLERVDSIRELAAAANQTRLVEMIQCGVDLRGRGVGDGAQQLVGKFPADSAADLRDPLESPHRVEARPQGVRRRRR